MWIELRGNVDGVHLPCLLKLPMFSNVCASPLEFIKNSIVFFRPPSQEKKYFFTHQPFRQNCINCLPTFQKCKTIQKQLSLSFFLFSFNCAFVLNHFT